MPARSVIAVLVGGVGLLAAPATALAADLAIPLDVEIVSGVAVGDEAPLADVATGPLAGRTCAVSSRLDESADALSGNDLVVASGTASTTLVDVEREPGAVTDGDSITLGETISVTLVMGPSGRHSGDVVVELECEGAAGGGELPATGGGEARILALAAATTAAGATLLLTSRRTRRTHGV